jgi:effector-binding domain-containing protein
MKKTLLISGTLLLLFLLSIYLFIPKAIRIKSQIHISASDANALKYISYSAGWDKWWPEKNSMEGTENKLEEFCDDSFCYQVLKTINSGADIKLKSKDLNSITALRYMPIGKDSMEVSLQTELRSGNSPIQRIFNYQKAGEITDNFDDVLHSMKAFFDNEKLVYGIDVKQDVVRHKTLLTIEKASSTYPDVNFVYKMVTDLTRNIRQYAGKETAAPMLNVYMPNQKNYMVTVAIPVSKEIPFTKPIFINTMVNGKLLVAEIKGGPQTIKNAMHAFDQYLKDKDLSSPAMPYEMMLTDRSIVRDTSKWVTQIYYPVY